VVNKDQVFDAGTSTRRFRIMLSDYAAVVLMTRAMPAIQQMAPNVAIELLSNSELALPSLDRGDIDLLMIARQYTSKSHPSEELFRDDYTCVVWAQNPAIGDDLTLVALAGETVVDYSLRLKRELPEENLIVAGYCHDVMCYIPTRRVLQEGGYEAVDNMIYYGQPGPFAGSVEEAIFDSIRRVAGRVGLRANPALGSGSRRGR